MKKGLMRIVLIGVGLMLGGCSLNANVESLYKEETHLQAAIQIPENFTDNHEESIVITLEQDGETVEDPSFVHAEIWKQDGSLSYPMEEVEQGADGEFYVKKAFDEDGLYSIKVHAAQGDSEITPQKQFIVGELSDEELEILQEDAPAQEAEHEHHH
ncbi:FixH family protein [Oceanobacillus kapialis]|uniref:FixH family protein n=1 Tax=Oceanobacillus kapialis TaxID=481353 RepID=A0ABW5Q2V2_9BACI